MASAVTEIAYRRNHLPYQVLALVAVCALAILVFTMPVTTNLPGLLHTGVLGVLGVLRVLGIIGLLFTLPNVITLQVSDRCNLEFMKEKTVVSRSRWQVVQNSVASMFAQQVTSRHHGKFTEWNVLICRHQVTCIRMQQKNSLLATGLTFFLHV